MLMMRHDCDTKSIHGRRDIQKVFVRIKQYVRFRKYNLQGTDNVSVVFGLPVFASISVSLVILLRLTMVLP